MKEGIQSIKIKPVSERLEFVGSTTKPHEGNRLAGNIILTLSRTVKIKSITLKFKGRYRTSRNNSDLQSPILSASVLPKLKTRVIDRSLVLQEGQQTFPWEILVPNVYPQTVTTERCSISYYLELKLSLGVGRSLIVEHPMTIQRHLIASPQSAALKNTKIHKYTSPGKIYCEIEVPKVICQGQDHFPILVRYACIHETRVKSITTHIIQSETCRLRGSAKTETEKRFGEQAALSKFVSDLSVMTTNYIESYPSNMDISPLLLVQNTPEITTVDVESPLVTISHQLEITFDLTHSKLQTRIPIAVTTLPQAEDQMALKAINYAVENQPHQKPLSVEISKSKRLSGLLARASSLKKRTSDQQIGTQDVFLTPSSSTKTAGSTKLLAIDTTLANKLRSMSVDETDEMKSVQLYYMNSPSQSIASPPIENKIGLFPPPRPRKKTLSSEHPSMRRNPTRDTMKKTPERNALPTPPTSGRLSEFSPLVMTSFTSKPLDDILSDTASVTRDQQSDLYDSSNTRKYPQSITNHYFSAQLPPLPAHQLMSSTSKLI